MNCLALPPRPARLRPQPAACPVARPGARGGAVCAELRRRRRKQRAARRPHQRDLPVGTGHRQASRKPPHEHGGMYEYGSRVGVWRILREFDPARLPLTVFGVVMALERYPELVRLCGAGDEIANHGLRWIHYQHMPEATERGTCAVAMRPMRTAHRRQLAPLGWYTGRDSPNTRRLVADQGGFEYDSDYYGDDLPFWLQVQKTDGSAGAAPGGALHAGHQRHALRAGAGLQHRRPTSSVPARRLRRAVRRRRRAPRMMSIGMHCRLLGKPGRMRALQRFLDHMQARTSASGSAGASTSRGTGRPCTPSTPPPPSSGLDQLTAMLTLHRSMPPGQPTSRRCWTAPTNIRPGWRRAGLAEAALCQLAALKHALASSVREAGRANGN
jgi:peptidoglycan/xylan/chitin deacetylase (PgdA/CDA1 family)